MTDIALFTHRTASVGEVERGGSASAAAGTTVDGSDGGAGTAGTTVDGSPGGAGTGSGSVPEIAFVGPCDAMGRVVGLANALLAELAALSLGGAGRDVLRSLVAVLGRVRAGADAAEARTVTALEGLDDGGVDAVEVLRRNAGSSQREARRRRRRAEALAQMPNVAGALAAGDISPEHADALARAAAATSAEAVDSDRDLLAQVAGVPADRAGRHVQNWTQRHQDPADLHEQHLRQWRRRHLYFGDGDDGMLTAHAAFDRVLGAQFRSLINGIADRLWRVEGGRDNPNGRSAEQRRLDALAIAVGLQPAPPVPSPAAADAGTAPGAGAGNTPGGGGAAPDGGNGAAPGGGRSTSSGTGAARDGGRNRPTSEGGGATTGDAGATPSANNSTSGGNGATTGDAGATPGANNSTSGGNRPTTGDAGATPGANNSTSDGNGVTTDDAGATPGANNSTSGGNGAAPGTGAAQPNGSGRRQTHGSKRQRTNTSSTGGNIDDGGGGATPGAGAARTTHRPEHDSPSGIEPASGSAGATTGGRAARPNGSRRLRTRESHSGPTNGSSAGGNIDDGGGRAVSARHQIVIVASADVVSGKDPQGRCEIPGIGPIPVSELERLACDAELFGVLFSGDGEPLWHGRGERTVTDAQRRALVARDGVCVLCASEPALCESHHIIPWAPPARGPTDIDNLALLCGTCHRRLHNHKRVLVRRPDGAWSTQPDPRHAHQANPVGPDTTTGRDPPGQ